VVFEVITYTSSHRIIREFYLAESDKSKRPKIFGMTASPVDAKVDVRQAAKYDPYTFRFIREILISIGNSKTYCTARSRQPRTYHFYNRA